MGKGLTLQAAAARMGICSRQVRRMIRAGRIKAAGGGHGVPLRFDALEVDRFRPDNRRRWKPFECAVPKWQVFARYSGTLIRADDILARTWTYAYNVGRMTNALNDAYSGFMQCASATFAKRQKIARQSRELWRRGVSEWLRMLIPLKNVRQDLKEAAEKLDLRLDSEGWDFVLAAKIIRHSPTQKATDQARRLERRQMISRRDKEFNNQRSLFLGHQELTQDHRLYDSGVLCDNAVAAVLGIHRQQAARMRKRVFNRLGNDIIWLVVALQVSVDIHTFSKTWLRSFRNADSEIFNLPSVVKTPEDGLLCPYCASPISDDDITCKKCGENVLLVNNENANEMIRRNKPINTQFVWEED